MTSLSSGYRTSSENRSISYTFIFPAYVFAIIFGKPKDSLISERIQIDSDSVFLQVTEQVQKTSFISCVLSDQVWWCNIKQFLSYYKITSENLWKPIDDIKYLTCIYTFESGKCGEKRKNTKIWISPDQKELFIWNEKQFSKFLKVYHLVKKQKFDKK